MSTLHMNNPKVDCTDLLNQLYSTQSTIVPDHPQQQHEFDSPHSDTISIGRGGGGGDIPPLENGPATVTMLKLPRFTPGPPTTTFNSSAIQFGIDGTAAPGGVASIVGMLEESSTFNYEDDYSIATQSTTDQISVTSSTIGGTSTGVPKKKRGLRRRLRFRKSKKKLQKEANLLASSSSSILSGTTLGTATGITDLPQVISSPMTMDNEDDDNNPPPAILLRPSALESTNEYDDEDEWYIVVANTPYTASVQLVSLSSKQQQEHQSSYSSQMNKSKKSPKALRKLRQRLKSSSYSYMEEEEDGMLKKKSSSDGGDDGRGGEPTVSSSQPTTFSSSPMTIWTAMTNAHLEEEEGGINVVDDERDANAINSSFSSKQGGGSSNGGTITENISCQPIILLQEPKLDQQLLLENESECFKIAIVLGTSHNRVLSIPLSVQSTSMSTDFPMDEVTSGGMTTENNSTSATATSGSNSGGGGGGGFGGLFGGKRNSRSVSNTTNSVSTMNTSLRSSSKKSNSGINYTLHKVTMRGSVWESEKQYIEALPLDTISSSSNATVTTMDDGSSTNISSRKKYASSVSGSETDLSSNIEMRSPSKGRGRKSSRTTATTGSGLDNIISEDGTSVTSIGLTSRSPSRGGPASKGSRGDGNTTTGSNGTGEDGTTATKEKKVVPFCPEGGVSTISSYSNLASSTPQDELRQADSYDNMNMIDEGLIAESTHEKESMNNINSFVWTSYGDGTIVRLPHWAFFPLSMDDADLDELLKNDGQIHGTNPLVRARLVVCTSTTRHSLAMDECWSQTTIPLPVFFPSLLSQPLDESSSGQNNSNNRNETMVISTSSSAEDGGYITDHHEFYGAVSYINEKNIGGTSEQLAMPTLGFYTNEDQLYSKTHIIVRNNDEGNSQLSSKIAGISTLIKGGAAFAKGMFGGVMGAVLGGAAGEGTIQEVDYNEEEEKVQGMEIGGGMVVEADTASVGSSLDIQGGSLLAASTLYPQLRSESASVPLGSVMFDHPRQILHASVDPTDGQMLACTDNLGRVQLIDLPSKQVVRMWKGFRDAKCYWSQRLLLMGDSIRTITYLVIHAKKRQVVEVYRLRHGPRVGKFNIKDDDAEVVQCSVTLKGGESYVTCFLNQTLDVSTPKKGFRKNTKEKDTKRCIIEEINFDDEDLNKNIQSSFHRHGSKKALESNPVSTLSDTDTVHLQLLKQLLASETNIESDLDAVYAALVQITAISDLCAALDLLAVATHLEDGMGVEDSSFHYEVVEYVKEQSNLAMKDEAIATSNNPHLRELSGKIDVHSQLIRSYDILHQFEVGGYADNDIDSSVNPKSKWIIEGLSWIDTYEEVTGQSIDMDLGEDDLSPLSFSTFAKACLQEYKDSTPLNTNGSYKLFLCDSTRDRKKILMHIFRPLLKDVFIFKTTKQILDEMGLIEDVDKMLTYFGEWFMSLRSETAKKTSLGLWCPTLRWLQEIIREHLRETTGHILPAYADPKQEEEEEDKVEIMLPALHKFCSECSDLPRAFLLAAICQEAISDTTKQFEDKTYGLISQETSTRPWNILLRKLRLCLLIRLRLDRVSLGAFPLTVANVEDGTLFSINSWIAQDELSISHKQSEINSLETTCWGSQGAFNPSSPEGDIKTNQMVVERSCKKIKDNNSHGHSNPLLLFLRHYDNSIELAAHRALLLSTMWGQDPKSLHLLKDAMSAMRFIGREGDEHASILTAVLHEIWQVHLRPLYRAILFGFEEVDELSEDILYPLCMNGGWLGSLHKISLELIDTLQSANNVEFLEDKKENVNTQILQEDPDSTTSFWPSQQDDFILKNYIQRVQFLQNSSLEFHKGVILSLKITDDYSMIPSCFEETFDTLFLRETFSQPFTPTFQADENQLLFINSRLRNQAISAEGPVIHHQDLDDIVALGRLWGLEKSQILTDFILIMYEVGKDVMVDDLVNSCARLIDLGSFLDGGIIVACVRLHFAVINLKKKRQYRSVIAMLDADTCQWVKEKAEVAMIEKVQLTNIGNDATLSSPEDTHALILRMLRMSPVSKEEIHALSIMSGTLLKAMEQFKSPTS